MATPDPIRARLDALERENARLHRAVEELSILNDLAREIGTARNVQDIMHTIIRRSLRAVKAEQGVITLVGNTDADPNRTLVRTSASSGEHPTFRAEESLLGWMQARQTPLLLNDPAHDERFKGTIWPPEVRSILCVPLLSQAHLIGILTLYNKKDSRGFTPGDLRLLAILAAQSAQVIENARLLEEEVQLQRLREEYRLAFEIQKSLLPSKGPSLPGYDVAGITRPAEDVGGDYYDFISLDTHRVALCVGDVSGKGLPAALLMANLQATLRGLSLSPNASASEIVDRANQMLCRSIRKGTFVTLFFGLLDVRTHRLQYVNAGHNRPLLRTRDGRVRELENGGIVLGFMPEFRFEQEEVQLEPGDTLLVYSDGISEAMNLHREQFDVEAITALLQAHAHTPAREQIRHYMAATHAHTGTEPQTDDMTLLVLRRPA